MISEEKKAYNRKYLLLIEAAAYLAKYTIKKAAHV